MDIYINFFNVYRRLSKKKHNTILIILCLNFKMFKLVTLKFKIFLIYIRKKSLIHYNTFKLFYSLKF